MGELLGEPLKYDNEVDATDLFGRELNPTRGQQLGPPLGEVLDAALSLGGEHTALP
jgi:hypothetical protein